MKYMKYLLILTVATIVTITSCHKEEGTVPTENVESFFTVSHGSYHEGTIPESSGNTNEQPSISTLQGASYVVPGGANTISLITDDPQGDVNKVYVGIKGVNGYFEITEGNKSKDTISVTIILNNTIPRDSFTIVFKVGDKNGNISEATSLPVKKTRVQKGKLEVALSWDLKYDLDLHVVQPDSEEIYYTHDRSSEGGYLDLDSNPACQIDGINNEHIVYPDSAIILPGTYIVRVDFFMQCNGSDSSIVHYTVTARYNGELINPVSGSNPYTGYFMPFTDDNGGAGSGVEVMRFNISDKKSTTLYAFEFPENTHGNKKGKKPCKNCRKCK